MLKVGVIGYGRRVSNMARALGVFDIPYRVVAIADPRAEEIKEKDDGFLSECVFYDTVDEMLEKAELDGVMIGTRCHLHTEMACKVAPYNLPLFLEKPVSITFAQVKALDQAFRTVTAPVVVSFPLRLTMLVQRIKEMLEADVIGSVQQVVAFADITYGSGYFSGWMRDYDQVGGLFLQKATHDFDYIHYLVGQKPEWIASMKAQRVYGEAGTIMPEKPFELRCVDCAEKDTCPEGPFNLFYRRYQGAAVTPLERRKCLFAEGIRNQDMDGSIIQYEGGAQATYTQNFFVRHRAGRRGARIYGYKGTIEFDWYQGQVKVFNHSAPTVDTIEFGSGVSHFGGDRELCYDFLMAMEEGRPSRAPLSAGILSALTCLCARQSAETRQFQEIKLPD